ncbi:MAG: xylose isomerase protein barrel [Clostridiales bacterium]|jgi:sugar phosphate isomerase/epimerase|nr:xylose isomerase protein barrel [Clostridiales bacterium]
MKESIKKYVKVGLINFMAYPSTMQGEGPILETVKKTLMDDYFDCIELTHIKDSEVRKQVKRMIEVSKISAAYGAQPNLLSTGRNINDINEERRKEAVEFLKSRIDEAIEIGAEGFAFLSGKYEEKTKEEAYQALVKSINELCEYARNKSSIKVALEVFDFDVDKKSLIGPVAITKRLAEEVCPNNSNFGLMVDLSHLPLLRETARESLYPIKDYIIHAHIGNAVSKFPSLEAYGDTHPRFGFPNSDNDVEELTEFLKVLFEIGYLNDKKRKIISFEVKPWKDEDPDLVIANAKRTLNLAWANLKV